MILDPYGRPIPNSRQRKAAARQQAIRAQIDAAYDAAQTTPENVRHWRWADGLSAAEANSSEVRRVIRERARYETSNNSFAWGMIRTLAADTIALGPNLQLQFEDPVINRAVETRWREWSRAVQLGPRLQASYLSFVVDGEVFLQFITNPRSRTRVQMDVRLIECDEFEDLAQTNTPEHVSGIHFDRAGNPVRYDRLESHPGSPYGGWRQSTPLSADDVIHLFDADRPGQIRGISHLTPALPLFAMLRRYTLAVLLAAETAADHAALLETMSPPTDEDGGWRGEDIDPFDSVVIDRGMMTALPKGWKMSQLRPEQPTTTYKEFRDAILNEIARCLGMPFNVAAASSQGYNYASGQLDHGPYHHRIKCTRQRLELQAIEPIFSRWLDEALLIPGYLPALPMAGRDVVPHLWYWGRREHGDPAKHATATARLHDLGLLTDEQYLLAEGVDPEDHHQSMLRQARRRAELAAITERLAVADGTESERTADAT